VQEPGFAVAVFRGLVRAHDHCPVHVRDCEDVNGAVLGDAHYGVVERVAVPVLQILGETVHELLIGGGHTRGALRLAL